MLYRRYQPAFSLTYHLLLVTKNRQRVIESVISDRLCEIFKYICPNFGIALVEWKSELDHVHIVFKAKPVTEISKFVNAYKSASSRHIKKEHPALKSKLYKERFWSQSFCILTTGSEQIDEVLSYYLESQGVESKV